MQACKNCIHCLPDNTGGYYCYFYSPRYEQVDYINGTSEILVKIRKPCNVVRDSETCQAYQEKKNQKFSMFKKLFSRE